MSIKMVMGAVLLLCVVGMVTALYAGNHAEKCHMNKERNKNLSDPKTFPRSADRNKQNPASF
jgi:hypothetical protein